MLVAKMSPVIIIILYDSQLLSFSHTCMTDTQDHLNLINALIFERMIRIYFFFYTNTHKN